MPSHHIPRTLNIEIIYCSTDTQKLRQIELPDGSSVSDVLAYPGLLADVGLIEHHDLKYGIFGKKCDPKRPLQQHDRLEIYRPLLLSPTEARRLRAKTLAET